MPINKINEFEKKFLAPYAMKSCDSRGRVHPEDEHAYRSCYQRDRDRIIHSAAFRRLEYKTQVFVNHEGDYYRTRLTHTIEMARQAGLVKPRSNWEKTPTDMLCARCSSRLARLVAPDIVANVYTPDELRESREKSEAA